MNTGPMGGRSGQFPQFHDFVETTPATINLQLTFIIKAECPKGPA